MKRPLHRHLNRGLKRPLAHAALALLGLPLAGCPLLEEGGAVAAALPDPPSAELKVVTLVQRPRDRQLAAWFCHDLAGGGTLARAGCDTAFGRKPNKPDLKFVFELSFDLGNPNGFPIPLVEILLALDVFQGEAESRLGALCVSFCDPDAGADCELAREDACQPPDTTVRGIDDLIPTLDDFIRIANDAITGDLFDDENLKFRMIPGAGPEHCGEGETGDCPGRAEAIVRFELGIDATLKVLEEVFDDGLSDLLSGRSPSFDIPYSALGTLFFNVPVLGRYAIEFGPLTGVWSLD